MADISQKQRNQKDLSLKYVKKKKSYQPRNLYLGKISLKSEDEIKMFHSEGISFLFISFERKK